MKAAPLVVVLALGFVGGFFVGGLSRKPAASTVQIRSGNTVERDLSPKGEVGTVKATAISQAPQKVPVPVPPELGTQLQTTVGVLPALEAGARFHVATFGQVEGNRLQLRPVAWVEGPQGVRVPFEGATTETPIELPIQTTTAPRWSVSLVLVGTGERVEPGAMVQHDRGGFRFTGGATRRSVLVGVGVFW